MRWLFGLLVAILLPAATPAHDLGVEWKVEGELVRVAAYFDDDTAAKGANVFVINEFNRTIARGETDDKGVWTFPRPPAGVYRIDVDAGAGHRRRVRMPLTAQADEAPASDEASRAKFTRSRWPELTAGLAIIAIGAVGLRWFLRHRRRATHSERDQGNVPV